MPVCLSPFPASHGSSVSDADHRVNFVAAAALVQSSLPMLMDRGGGGATAIISSSSSRSGTNSGSAVEVQS